MNEQPIICVACRRPTGQTFNLDETHHPRNARCASCRPLQAINGEDRQILSRNYPPNIPQSWQRAHRAQDVATSVDEDDNEDIRPRCACGSREFRADFSFYGMSSFVDTNDYDNNQGTLYFCSSFDEHPEVDGITQVTCAGCGERYTGDYDWDY